MIIEVKSEDEMKAFGKTISGLLNGNEIIELTGDVGAGKTTLVKGIAVGLGINEYVQSPSFTISRIYQGRDEITLAHYDFYRLNDAGIMANELEEIINEPKTVTIIEWGEIVTGVLPSDRLSINIAATSDTSRSIVVSSGGPKSNKLKEQLEL